MALLFVERAAKKVYAQCKATMEMIQDSAFDVEAWRADKVSDKFSRMEHTAFMAGDGVSQPRGHRGAAAAVDRLSAGVDCPLWRTSDAQRLLPDGGAQIRPERRDLP